MNVFIGITRNRLFMGIIGITVLLQVLIIKFLGKFAKTIRLNWKLWLVSTAIGLISWPLAYVGKFIPVPQTPLHAFFAPLSRCPGTHANLVIIIFHQAVGVKCRSVVPDTDKFIGKNRE